MGKLLTLPLCALLVASACSAAVATPQPLASPTAAEPSALSSPIPSVAAPTAPSAPPVSVAPTTEPSQPTPTSEPSPTTAPTFPPPSEQPDSVRFEIRSAAQGFERPLYVTNDGGPRLFIVEQGGLIKVLVKDGDEWEAAGVFLDLRDRANPAYESQGVLGLAFHPAFATNGLFYVFYTRRSTFPARDGDTVIAEFQRQTDVTADPTSHREVLTLDNVTPFHFGGWLGFGPDGYLYIGTGDGGGIGDPRRLAQDLTNRFSKLLRIDPLDPPGPERYTVPSDNPFVGRRGDDLIWAYGLRNPWRNSFDPVTGDLWIGDVGQSLYEEINRASPPDPAKGLNFGWAICEGRHAYTAEEDPGPCRDPGVTLPVVEYPHVVDVGANCASIGGHVYRGTQQASLVGRYFFGDFCSGRIWSIPIDFDAGGGDRLRRPINTGVLITSFGEDAERELYLTTFAGTLYHLVERD